VADQEDFGLESLVFDQVLNAFTLHWAIDEIVEFGNNGESDEIEHDVDCVISRTNHEDISELDEQTSWGLQETAQPRKRIIVKPVVVIWAELHHAHAG